MRDWEDALLSVLGIWLFVVLFITCPIWGVPYLVIRLLINLFSRGDE